MKRRHDEKIKERCIVNITGGEWDRIKGKEERKKHHSLGDKSLETMKLKKELIDNKEKKEKKVYEKQDVKCWNFKKPPKLKMEHINVSSNIHKKECFKTLRSELKNEKIAEFFLTNFEVFGYLMKHDFRVYDITAQSNPYLKRKSGLKLSKFNAS